MSVVGITAKGNPEQEELIRLIMENDKSIIFATGNSGTGKSLIAIATALELVCRKRKFSKIIYSRNAIDCSASLGFVPGDIKEKYDGYLFPLYDNLDVIEAQKAITRKEAMTKIDCFPINYIRGRSINDAILVIDECQNFNVTELRTILTRVGKYAKIILLGSFNQIDDRRQDKHNCSFKKVIDKLKDLDFVGYVELKQSMRSPWCSLVDDLLGEIQD